MKEISVFIYDTVIYSILVYQVVANNELQNNLTEFYFYLFHWRT